jgi:predicted O-methyltransferase YrrM
VGRIVHPDLHAESAAESEALRGWVAREGATRTVEVGLGYGVPALHACEVLLENADPTAARHVAVEPHQAPRFSGCGLQSLEEAGVAGMVAHRAEESRIALPRFLEESRGFDLAFVDGDHRFEGVFVDLSYLGRLVRPGGMVFLDDYQLPAVERVASFFLRNLDRELEELSEWDDLHRWAVLRTSTTPDTRHFDYYVDFREHPFDALGRIGGDGPKVAPFYELRWIVTRREG